MGTPERAKLDEVPIEAGLGVFYIDEALLFFSTEGGKRDAWEAEVRASEVVPDPGLGRGSRAGGEKVQCCGWADRIATLGGSAEAALVCACRRYSGWKGAPDGARREPDDETARGTRAGGSGKRIKTVGTEGLGARGEGRSCFRRPPSNVWFFWK